MLYTNSNIPCSICTKLHMFDKSIGLKTSTCQCLVIDIAPPGGYRKLLVLHQLKHALSATFHVHVRKSVHLCNLTIPTKKSPGTKSETQQEVGYFEFSRHILCHFCHFQVSYFNELLPEIYSDEHQNWSL